MVDKVPVELAESVPPLGNVFEPLPMVTLLRFGHWDEVLALPKPSPKLMVAVATWHYAHGIALVRTGKVNDAEQDLASIKAIAADPELPKQHARRTEAPSMVAVAENVLAGEIAAAKKQYDDAVVFLTKAVDAQDAIPYSEPENWFNPSRDVLGAVLLDANRPADAEKVYRKDLEQHRGNGWSLFGLAKALRAQGKDTEAAKVDAEFNQAWTHADVKLTASRF
jgi:tetratricopeptide (TPR) repeat protein